LYDVLSDALEIHEIKAINIITVQFGANSQIYRNATGHVIGYGGVFYEELNWISQRLNFRYNIFLLHLKNVILHVSSVLFHQLGYDSIQR